MSTPRTSPARAFKVTTPTGADTAITATASGAYASIVPGLANVAVAGQVGDVLELTCFGIWLNEAPQSNVGLYIVNPGTSAVIRGMSNGGWIGLPLSAYVGIGGSAYLTLVGSDIMADGNVTIRPIAWVSAGTRTLAAGFQWAVRNLGPPDPY